jgi:hypothetical protein
VPAAARALYDNPTATKQTWAFYQTHLAKELGRRLIPPDPEALRRVDERRAASTPYVTTSCGWLNAFSPELKSKGSIVFMAFFRAKPALPVPFTERT